MMVFNTTQMAYCDCYTTRYLEYTKQYVQNRLHSNLYNWQMLLPSAFFNWIKMINVLLTKPGQ